MRLSVCIPMFFRGIPFPEAIKKIAQLGYDAAEMWGIGDLDPDVAAAACKEYGVELLAICTSYFNMTDDACHPQFLQGIQESCAVAKRMGVKKLITQVGPDTGAPRAQQHANIVSALKQAAPILEENGIMLVVEPLNTLVNHKGYYLWSAVEGFEIIREVNSPAVKLLYDIYHQQVMEGNIIANVTENLDLIGHLHSAGCPGRNELHFGENDYNVIFRAIDKAGYTGACALEYRPLLDPEESLRETKKRYS